MRIDILSALLREIGILASRAEEQEISYDSYHKQVADTLVKARRGFCRIHNPRH